MGGKRDNTRGKLIVPQRRAALPEVPPRTIVARFDEQWDIAMSHHPGVSPFKLIVAGLVLEQVDVGLAERDVAEREVNIKFSEDWHLISVAAHATIPTVYLVALGRFMVMRGEFILDMGWAQAMQASAALAAQNQSILSQIARQKQTQ